MPTVDMVGWIAGALVLAAFYVKTMVPLRCVAIASNAAFISYALLAGAMPILVLHTLLLPMNVLRLHQLWRLSQRIKRTARFALPLEALAPCVNLRRLANGAKVFEKGGPAEDMVLVLRGRVRLVEYDALVGAGELVGEMGMFTPGRRRTATALCVGDVELASIPECNVWELLHRSPEFGACLLRLAGAQHAATAAAADRRVARIPQAELLARPFTRWRANPENSEIHFVGNS